MNGFDKSTDAFVFGNTFDKREEMSGMPNYVLGRYLNFASAKSQFYNSIQALVGGGTEISGIYQGYIYKKDKYGNDTEEIDTRYYQNYNNQHYGIDLGTGGKNPPIFAGISGIVRDVGYDDVRGYGNFVQIEYGYQFEGYTYRTGIVGEYAHMKDLPLVSSGQFVTTGTNLGLVGNTGKSTKEHLHYSVYTTPGKSYAANVASRILGKDYLSTAMTNNTKEKTVYNPTAFIDRYKGKY
jgi:murein DD-endopeptidase MepM/ murein hydrolase activator NlpD